MHIHYFVVLILQVSVKHGNKYTLSNLTTPRYHKSVTHQIVCIIGKNSTTRNRMNRDLTLEPHFKHRGKIIQNIYSSLCHLLHSIFYMKDSFGYVKNIIPNFNLADSTIIKM